MIFLFSSCYSNAIYFDIENQSIKSCNIKGIRQIYIESDSSNEMYLISWTDSTLRAPRDVKLKNIQSGYSVYKNWNNEIISNIKFKLSALSAYSIERVQDDASGYKIKVWTDWLGNVNKTSQPLCSH